MSDSPAAGNPASPEAERAWDAWYEPEQDFARFMVTSPYDKMREAFAAGFAVAAAAERERLLQRILAWECPCGEEDCDAFGARAALAALIEEA